MRHFFSLLAMLTTTLAIGTPADARATVPKPPTDQPAVPRDVTQLNQYVKLQKSLKIQNPDLACGMRKAILMADLLIGDNGLLSTFLESSIKSAFISSQPEEYEKNMIRVINQLDDTWQPFFSSIKAPQDPSSIGNLVLRGLFSLKADEAVTDRHAQVAVLSAMLAPYNQGPVGDCFSVNDVIRDRQEYYRHAAKDYKSIVMQGFITRPVDNSEDAFFFLPILADDDRDQPFNLTVSGTFPHTNDSLFDAPGFAAARDLMGGDVISDLTNKVMQFLSHSAKEDRVQVSAAQVLAAMAKAVAAETSNASIDQLRELGEYAFSCLTNNPILRAVESAFAAMAEDRARDSTRGNINDCVAKALKNTWSSLEKMDEFHLFQQTFTSTFNASYRLLYNLNIPLPQVSADGSSTDGGFQLYKRAIETPWILGTRVETPQQFRQLILDAIVTTTTALGATSETQAIASQVSSFILTDRFLREALWAYDPNNKKESHPVPNYRKLSRTPMQSCDGDNPYEVDDIDTEVTYDNDVQSFIPNNAKDLISWCLKLAKKAPAEMIPMDSPQHAFNFMPTSPDLVAFVKNEMNAGQWIQQTLIIPGMQVARQQIDPLAKKAIATAMYNLLSHALPNQSFYQTLVQNLAEQKLSVQRYAQKLLDGVNKLLGSNRKQAHEVSLALDSVLLQNLTQNDQAILSQSAIRFAFTNWNEGTEDIYFCAFFNPRTEKVSFGTIFEDKTNLQPMDEDAWVNHQQWDVDLKPFAPKNVVSGT